MTEKFKEINIDFHLECKKCDNKTFEIGISDNNELVFTCCKCSLAILVLSSWPNSRVQPGADGIEVKTPTKDLN